MVLPASLSTLTRQRSPDQSAATTRWPYRILVSMPRSRAVSWRYARIEPPSASVLVPVQGRNE